MGFTIKVIETMQFLLPGFVSAWVFYALTAYPKESQFERFIQALIFTMIIQSIVGFSQFFIDTLKCNEELRLFFAFVLALILGLLLAYFSNNDKLHKFLRYFKITKETSYASEWSSAFSSQATHITLHLNDGKRIYGWTKEWPSDPNNGHFYLKNASWLTDTDEIPLKEVNGILINNNDVNMVEFMKHDKGEDNG